MSRSGESGFPSENRSGRGERRQGGAASRLWAVAGRPPRNSGSEAVHVGCRRSDGVGP